MLSLLDKLIVRLQLKKNFMQKVMLTTLVCDKVGQPRN